MEEKARDLRAAGREAEAERLMQEARELRAKFQRPAPPSGERPAATPRRQALDRRMAELKLELKRRTEEGRQAEVEELREQMRRLERELSSPEGLAGETVLRRREPPRLAGGPEARETDRRLAHLQRAVESLRAGGMPEIAARLEQAGKRIRERLERGGPHPVPSEEIERLRAEVRELRQGMQEMKRRLEEVGRRQVPLHRRGER